MIPLTPKDLVISRKVQLNLLELLSVSVSQGGDSLGKYVTIVYVVYIDVYSFH